MTLIDFINEFPDEASCNRKFKEYRNHVGVVCPRIITGNETRKVMNARDAAIVKVYDPTRLCTSRSYRIAIGLSVCTC